MLHVVEAVEGGVPRHVRDVVRATRGLEHHLAAPTRRVGGETDERAVPAIREAGATVHPLAMTRRPPSATNARAALALRRLVRCHGIDVVHGHSSIGGALARLCTLGTGVPVVYTPNGLHDHQVSRVVERLLGPLTDQLVAVSASEAGAVRARHLVPEHRLTVIPNGIDPRAPSAGPDLRALASVPTGAPLVLWVARFVPQKAPAHVVEVLVRVLQEHPDAYALVVGDGTLRDVVAAARDQPAAGGRLRWLTHVDHVAAGMATADVVVLLSEFEGAPYVPLEALRAGVPVVVTDVVGSRDVVTDGRTGLVVPPGDVRGAVAAVGRLLDDPELRRRLGAAGPSEVSSRWSIDEMGARLAELYTALARPSDGDPADQARAEG